MQYCFGRCLGFQGEYLRSLSSLSSTRGSFEVSKLCVQSTPLLAPITPVLSFFNGGSACAIFCAFDRSQKIGRYCQRQLRNRCIIKSLRYWRCALGGGFGDNPGHTPYKSELFLDAYESESKWLPPQGTQSLPISWLLNNTKFFAGSNPQHVETCCIGRQS